MNSQVDDNDVDFLNRIVRNVMAKVSIGKYTVCRKKLDFWNRTAKNTVGKHTVCHKDVGFFESYCGEYYRGMHISS